MEDSKNITSPNPRLTRRCWLLAGLTLLPFWSIIIYYAVSESGGLPFLILQGAAVIMGGVNLFFFIYFTFIKPVRGEGGELKPSKWKPPFDLQLYRHRVVVGLFILLPFFYLLIFNNKAAFETPYYLVVIVLIFLPMILADLPKCNLKELKKSYYNLFFLLFFLTVFNLYLYLKPTVLGVI